MMDFEQLDRACQKWASDRGIDKFSNRHQQLNKLIEEVGELAAAILKDKTNERRDAIGDIYVVMSILCDQLNESPTACFNLAWHEIKDRKGETKDGTFVREVSNG